MSVLACIRGGSRVLAEREPGIGFGWRKRRELQRSGLNSCCFMSLIFSLGVARFHC